MEKQQLGGRCSWAVVLALATLMVAPLASAQSLPAKNQAAAVLVGHSLINFEMPVFLQALADSKGLQFAKAVQVMIGAPLRTNLEGCRRATSALVVDPEKFAFSCDAIAAGSPLGPYDTLVLTDANNTIASLRQWQRTDEAIADYMDIFLARNPAGRVMLFTTWESTNTYGAAWPDRQAADLAIYEDMARAATAIAATRGHSTTVEVIPVDIAIRDLIIRSERGDIPGITNRSQIFYDDVHMSRLGNYYVACVVFAGIFNRSPEGGTGLVLGGTYANAPVMIDLPVSTASAIQRLAWEVVSTYRGSVVAPLKPKPPGSLLVR
jgi:hypothetical protein